EMCIRDRGTSLLLVNYGTIKLRSDTSLAERIGKVFNNLNLIWQKFKPDIIGIEDIFVSKNAKSALKLGQIRGAAISSAHLNNIQVMEFAPTLIKSCLTGNGRAEKEQVAFMVCTILGLPSKPKSLDESDALAIAITTALRKSF
ncbi:MAG: crossover junction endodeoxyribonuclease RuvC, partial [Acidobacteria bacterium]|nr:crossover junction endodeoxyribonuclease RuvC [Acidobacteriota bacterium]